MLKIKIMALLLSFMAFFLCIISSVLHACIGNVFFDTIAYKGIFWFTVAGVTCVMADSLDKRKEKLYFLW
jgi:hypothetical protein